MWENVQLILLLVVYIVVTFFVIKFIAKLITKFNPYLKLLILSFLYALIWGVGIAANGGDPGFALPAPNIIAIILMLNIGLYHGVALGLYVLGLWWVIIFLFMLSRYLYKRRQFHIR